jgi:capsular exopolysaccharide synthesis family protein
MEPRDADLTLQRTLLVLRRRAHWIVLCFVLATAIAFGLSKLQTKKYTATASLNFNETSQAAELLGLANQSSASQQSIQDTNVLLLEVGDVAAKTARQIGHGLTPGGVANALGISPQGDTSVVNISATSTSPTLAADIANTYSTIFVNEQENGDHATFVAEYNKIEQTLSKLSPAARLGTAGIDLTNRAAVLNVLIGLPAGTVTRISSASPPRSASSPKTRTNTILGAIIGLLLGLAVVILLERVDQRIREPKDLEDIYGLPLLGVVPESTALSRSGRDRGSVVLPPREAEVFHLIRAHLRYFEVDRDLRMLLVASAASGDGKTTVARSLAMAAAQMGSRVLLLEADLRRPTIAHPLGLSPGPGLADVLIGAASLSEATQLVDTDPISRDLSRGRPLSVLVAGATPPPNPGELLESHAMERVLEQSRVAYDLVVIDTAPLTVVSDSFPLLRKVDGVIIVGRVGRERRDVAQRLRQTLASGGGPLLGVIANGVNTRRNPAYGYTYAYDYAAGEGDVVTPTLS